MTRSTAAPRPFDDIPLERGWPVFGNTFKILADHRGFARKMYAKHGPIYRSRAFFGEQVVLLGPEANEFFFMDKQRKLSSARGWAPYLEKLFPRSLMLMDFDEHRAHRKIMSVPFKTGPMKAYVARINKVAAAALQDWAGRGEFAFYPAIKQLSLDMAADIFLGLEPGPETERINQALTDMVAASVAVIRAPLPGTRFRKGVKGRETMIAFLSAEIPKRRGSDAGDMFTILCNATDEDGNAFTDEDIVNHMTFLWMAAHDTITSSLTTLIYELGRHPDWQDRLAEEIAALQLNDPDLPYEALARMPLTEAAFKEALRINAPVPAIPRRLVSDTDFGGYHLPQDKEVSVHPGFSHHMPEVWPDPERFDPQRFTEEGGARERHKFAWVPFGGGAHMCLGLHFAYMAAKIFLAHALAGHRFALRPGYRADFQIIPIPKPKDGLPVTLKAA